MNARPKTPAVKCAKCGAPLAAPEFTESIDEHRVRHHWKCGPCNYSFAATIASPGLKRQETPCFARTVATFSAHEKSAVAVSEK
jgi:hypothetical protein